MRDLMIALLTCSLTMSVLALCYMAATPLLSRRYSAQGRYVGWLVIIIGLIIPFRPRFGGALIQVDVPPGSLSPIASPGGGPHMGGAVQAAALSTNLRGISLWDVLAALWLAGAIALLAHRAIQHRRFVKMAGRWSKPVTNQCALALLRGLMAELGISGRMGLHLCACIGTPMLIGFAQPRILLPLSDFTADELRLILKHELVHYKRKDMWCKCLVLLATAMHWFNPIAYLIARAIDVQCELSCDAETVRDADAGARRRYSEAIIGAARSQSRWKTALSTNFYGGKRSMKNRIRSILDTGGQRAGRAVVCATLIVTLGTGLALAANVAASAPQTSYEVTVSATTPITIDRVAMYERYRPYGLNYDAAADKLYYQGALVRYFEDFYPIDEFGSVGVDYFNRDGAVDVHGVRDLSRIVLNTDGSTDPGGILLGVAPYSQAEFDARDIAELINPQQVDIATTTVTEANSSETISPPQMAVASASVADDSGSDPINPPQVAVASTSVADVSSNDPASPPQSIATESAVDSAPATYAVASSADPWSPGELAAIYAIYEPFGVTYDQASGDLFYQGKRVGLFRDILSSNGESLEGGKFSGAIRNLNSPDGEIDIQTVRDYDNPDAEGFGRLIGIEVRD